MSIPNLKYKTTLCKNWEEGTPCEKGPGCYFAHGQQQLRKIEENQQQIANRNTYLLHYQYSNNYKTVYCKFYAKGQCKLGASCTFAHQKKQKRKMNKIPVFQQPLLPPIPPIMQYNIPFFYPHYYNFGGQIYYGQSISPYHNYQNIDEKDQYLNQIHEKDDIQPKSQEKKRPIVGQISTSEKSPNNVENQEDQLEMVKKSSSFNLQ